MEKCKAITKSNSSVSKEKLLALISSIVFVLTTIFGVIKIFDSNYVTTQATLIIIESLVGLFFSLLPVLIHKLFKIRISFIVQIVIISFMTLAIIFGEVFEFYYKVFWWDSFMHLFSGFGIALIAYCFICFLLFNSNTNYKFAICLIGAMTVSLAIGMLWEIAEFTIDSAFGTNMQKFMPEVEPFFNGGQTHVALSGTQEQFVEFFSSPKGYRYALMDTMSDILYCLGGSSIIILVSLVTKNSTVFNNAFVKDSFTTSNKTINEVPVFETFEPILSDIIEPSTLTTSEPILSDISESSTLITSKPILSDTVEPSTLITSEPIPSDTVEPSTFTTSKPILSDTVEPSTLTTSKPILSDIIEPSTFTTPIPQHKN